MPILFPEAEVIPTTPRKEKPILQAYTMPRCYSTSDKNENPYSNYNLASGSLSKLFPKEVEKSNENLLSNKTEMNMQKELDNRKQVDKWNAKEIESEATDLFSNKINDIISFLDEDVSTNEDFNVTEIDDIEVIENTCTVINTMNNLKIHNDNMSSDDALKNIKQGPKNKYPQLKNLCVTKENIVDSLENNSLSQITNNISLLTRSEDPLFHDKNEKKLPIKVTPPRCTVNILSNIHIPKPNVLPAVYKLISSSNANTNYQCAETQVSNTEICNINKKSVNEKVASFVHSEIHSSRCQDVKSKTQTHTCDNRIKNALKKVNCAGTNKPSSKKTNPDRCKQIKIMKCSSQTNNKKQKSYTRIPIYTIDSVQKNPVDNNSQTADQLVTTKIDAPARMMLLKEMPSNVSSTECVKNSKLLCKLCGFYFTDKIDMINHMVIRHNAESEPVVSILDIDPSNIIEAHSASWKGCTLNYQCCACPQKFVFNHNLLVHLFCKHEIDLISNVRVEYRYYKECVAYRCVFCRLICTEPGVLKEHLLVVHQSAIIDDNQLELENLSSFVCVRLTEEYVDCAKDIETKDSSKHFSISSTTGCIDKSECKGNQKLTESNHIPQRQVTLLTWKRSSTENKDQTIKRNSHNSVLRGNKKRTKITIKNTGATAEHNTPSSILRGIKGPTDGIQIPEKEDKITIFKGKTCYSVLFSTNTPTEGPDFPENEKKPTTEKTLTTVERYIPEKEKEITAKNTIIKVEHNTRSSLSSGIKELTETFYVPDEKRKSTPNVLARVDSHNLVSKGNKEETECICILENEQKTTTENINTTVECDIHNVVTLDTNKLTESMSFSEEEKISTTENPVTTVEPDIHNSVLWDTEELTESLSIPEEEKKTTTENLVTTVEPDIYNSVLWNTDEQIESLSIPEEQTKTITKNTVTTVESAAHYSISTGIKELTETLYVPVEESKSITDIVTGVDSHNSELKGNKDVTECLDILENENEATTENTAATVEHNIHISVTWDTDKLTKSLSIAEKDKHTKSTVTRVESDTYNSVSRGLIALTETQCIAEKEQKNTTDIVTKVDNHNSELKGNKKVTEDLYIPQNANKTATENTVTTVECITQNSVSKGADEITISLFLPDEEKKTVAENTHTTVENKSQNLVLAGITKLTEHLYITKEENSTTDTVSTIDTHNSELKCNKVTECVRLSENKNKIATEKPVTTVEYDTHTSIATDIEKLKKHTCIPEEENKTITENMLTRESNTHNLVSRGIKQTTENHYILEEQNKSTTDTIATLDSQNPELKTNKKVRECLYIPETKNKSFTEHSCITVESNTHNTELKANEDLTGSFCNSDRQESAITVTTNKFNNHKSVSKNNSVLTESHNITENQEKTTTENSVKRNKYYTRGNSKSKNSKNLTTKKDKNDSVALEKVNINLPCLTDVLKFNTSTEQDVLNKTNWKDSTKREQGFDTFLENKNEPEQSKNRTELVTPKSTEINELLHVVPQKPNLQNPLHKNQLSKSDSELESNLMVNKEPVDVEGMTVKITNLAPRKGTSCKLCKKKFPSKDRLEEHMRRHICEYCNLMFKNMTYIPKHQALVHKEQLNMYKEIKKSD